MTPFIDLQAQQAVIKQKLEQRINQVLSHGQYILGPEVAELEQQLAAYCQVKHAITCASGTDALIMALYALQVKPGDVVITTPYSFIAATEAIALVGAFPLFCDVNPQDFNLDESHLEVIINDFYEQRRMLPSQLKHQLPDNSKIVGVIAVDLFGLPCNYSSLNHIAKKNNLFVIADAAQSFGASINEKTVGTLADITTTSFFPAKPLGCYGDGGALFTDSDILADTIRSIRIHGQGTAPYEHVRIGINSRLDTIQAAILLEKLAIFNQEHQQRQVIAEYYQAAFQQIGLATQLFNTANNLIEQYPTKQSAWAQFTIQANSKDHRSAIESMLKTQRIPYNLYYPIPIHLQAAYHYIGYQQGDMPVTEGLSQTLFSVPMHPYLDETIMNKVVNVIANVDDKKL